MLEMTYRCALLLSADIIVILFRYLTKEVGMTLLALISILVLIFMSNQVMLYLNRAASGVIPGMLIMQLLLLEMPNLLCLLLPLGFYFAILVAYGRLYADSEMVVLQACGYSSTRLLMHTLWMALAVATLITYLISLSPMLAYQRMKLLRTTGLQTLIQTIIPGRFRAVMGDQYVFFVESLNRNHTRASGVFVAKRVEHDGLSAWDVITAQSGMSKKDAHSGEEYLILTNGNHYQGQPGHADYQILTFRQYEARLPHQNLMFERDIRAVPFRQLLPWNNVDHEKAAELQWRVSIPLMVFCLTIVGVPMSRVNPRAGKYAKLLPGVLMAFVYANFMFVTRNWVATGKIPIWLGMWWLHALVIALGLALLWRQRVSGS